MAEELKHKSVVEWEGGRTFQVEVIYEDDEYKLKFKIDPNGLVVSLKERDRLLQSVNAAIKAITAHTMY